MISMPIRYLGYACKNTILDKKNIRMRTVRKSTFESGGDDIISEKILHNLKALYSKLEWNLENDIYAFRIGSELFPWLGNYDVTKFDRYRDIEYECGFIGEYARENNIRLSFHPGPFNVLCSPNPKVVEKTTKELEAHSEIFDLMGYEPSFNTKINIHVGGVYGNKEAALEEWMRNYYQLSDSLRKRLVIENDDKQSMYSVQDLIGLHELCNGELPITFDYFHHSLHPDGLSEKDALELCVNTWPSDVVAMTHYSESRRTEKMTLITDILENNGIPLDEIKSWPKFNAYYEAAEFIKENAHSDFCLSLPKTYGNTVDVMLEAKAKEQALLGLRNPNILQELITNF